jgi:ubiquinone/menaquinone biosynthesis C-methylase UbiE
MPGSYHSHSIFARVYPRLSAAMERTGGAELRDRMLAGLTGRVIEVGAGDGMNFMHYPPGVTSVLAVEPEPYLREIAERRAAQAPVTVKVVEGVAESLPGSEESFDAAVVSLVLCSVGDPRAVLTEVHRVLKPGGELRFLEHVRAQTPVLLGVQRVLGVIWPMLFGGCHLTRDPSTAIRAAGFTIGRLDRLRFPDAPVSTPTTPHILGVASRLSG